MTVVSYVLQAIFHHTALEHLWKMHIFSETKAVKGTYCKGLSIMPAHISLDAWTQSKREIVFLLKCMYKLKCSWSIV